jgi:TonB family protein
MDLLTLPNLAAYSAQVVVLIALATALSWVLRIDAAPVRYGFWRTVLAICLLLPLLQDRQAPARAAAASTSAVQTEMTVVDVVPAGGLSSIDWRAMVLPIVATGIAGRLLWLALNLVRLRRLRRSGAPAGECSVHSEMSDVIGTRPEIRYVARLRQPVTFGLLRPVVLLPSTLASQTEDIQRAVVSHELFHVKRRDWGWLLLEEIVCAMLWFNPAIWWLISRLHLAREVVVDELAVLATGRRRAYMEALIAFAHETSPAPVAAFGGRAQLFDRIVLLSKESGMSARRLLFTLAVIATALGTGTWRAVQAFPLVAADAQSIQQTTPGPLEQRAKPVTPENPIPRRTNFEPAFYPAEARAAGARGSVTLMLTLDELGRVAEARRVAIVVESANPGVTLRLNNTKQGDEKNFLINGSRDQSDTLRAIVGAMDNAAIRAVQGWRYDPPAAAPISFPVLISISEGADAGAAPPGAAPTGGGVRADGALRIGGAIKTPVKIKDVRPVYPPDAQAAKVTGLVIVEARIGADGSVEDAHVLRSVPLLDQAAIDAVMQWRFRPTLLNGKAVPVIMTVTVNFTLQNPPEQPPALAPNGDGTRSSRPSPPERQEPPVPVKQESRVLLRDESPVVVRDVKPRYTREAMDAGVQGAVELQVVIGTDGHVIEAKVLTGHPMLHEPALNAVRQWEFRPIAEPKTVNIELTFSLRSNK